MRDKWEDWTKKLFNNSSKNRIFTQRYTFIYEVIYTP